MKIYISLLRGINVSGQKKIKMTELKELYESLNFSNVTTYIQSGNVVFCSKEKSRVTIIQNIESRIKEIYHFDVSVFILSHKEIQKVNTNNPFNSPKYDLSKLYITFLDSIPDESLIKNIANFKSNNEEFKIYENIIYFYCPDGYGRTKLNNNFFEKKLKVTATTRNWKTANKLSEMIYELECESYPK